MLCFFVSDLHGRQSRVDALMRAIETDRPDALFFGGDMLPAGLRRAAAGAPGDDDVTAQTAAPLAALKASDALGRPAAFLILGNDDPRILEQPFLRRGDAGVWTYVHMRTSAFDRFSVTGYSFVPPTPFRLKDWERYDVSRFVDPGCLAPEEGLFTAPVDHREILHRTIQDDLDALAPGIDMENALFLFHSPPYNSALDRAALDGKMIDHAPLDVHVGSVAIRKFIERRQPLLTMHGHIHESARITGSWRDRIGRTHLFSAAHDGPELALVRFDPGRLEKAERVLL